MKKTTQKKSPNGISKINRICKSILKLTESDFAEAIKMADGQAEYISPLKPAFTAQQNEMGKRNANIISSLYSLRTLIENNNPKYHLNAKAN